MRAIAIGTFCLFAGGLPLAGAAAPDDLEELAVKLTDPDGPVRRRAVSALADLGSSEAFELVIGALGDPEGEVADTAQLRLGECPLELREDLWGKRGLGSKDPLVRERVAELLGRLDPAPPAEVWRDAIGDREDAVRSMGLWSLERAARASRIEWDVDADRETSKLVAELEKAGAKAKPGAVRGRALLAWSALDPERAIPELFAALEAKDEAVRCGAATALGLLPFDAAKEQRIAGELARGLAEDDSGESAGLRRLRARALADRRGRAAALELVKALEQVRLGGEDAPETLVEDLLAALWAISGLKHGPDPRPWRDWVEELREDWRGSAPGSDVRERGDDAGATVARLAGLPVPTGSVAFLIDMSGSMWNTDSSGRTMKELVDVELARCLEALPESARFNVLPYATEPTAWEKKLVPATPRNRSRAIADFVDCRLSGKGNLWDAIQLALEDPEVESILIFTDGAPTGGPRWEADLMVDLLLEAARVRPIQYHAVVTEDRNGRLVRAWQRLCRESGGRSIVVDREALADPSEEDE